jgi:hypothetical protein
MPIVPVDAKQEIDLASTDVEHIPAGSHAHVLQQSLMECLREIQS